MRKLKDYGIQTSGDEELLNEDEVGFGHEEEVLDMSFINDEDEKEEDQY